MSIPVIAFAGFSGAGKTTLIEKLIRYFREKDLRVGVVKHDAHGLSFDGEGKDSARFSAAGATQSIVNGPNQTACFYATERTLEETIQQMENVDLILVEGYKHCNYPQIGIARQQNGKGFTDEASHFIALVTDEPMGKTEAPKTLVFSLDEIEKIGEFIMEYMNQHAGVVCEENIAPTNADFTHFNDEGRAKMVNVGDKSITKRQATAKAVVSVNKNTFSLIQTGGMKKGDVLTVAQIAGVMGAKKTPDLIPMCHPILLQGIDLSLSLDEANCCVEIYATVSCEGKTGVEMEALTAAATAALTVYDMCKAVQKDMVIRELRLIEKTGGVHGDYRMKGDK